MAVRRNSLSIAVMALVVAMAGCGGTTTPSVIPLHAPADQPQVFAEFPGGSLGPVVTDSFGGGIFGWDIDQNGNDGLLSETLVQQNGTFLNGIETFDESTGKITKVVRKTLTNGEGPEPVVDAITGNDVGLIDGERYFIKNSRIIRDDEFYAMNPVTGEKITGSWSPGHVEKLLPSSVTENPASSNQFLMAYREELQKGFDAPVLYPYDVAQNSFGQPFVFPQKQVLAGYLLYAAVYPKGNLALTGYVPPPFTENTPLWFDAFDAHSGKLLQSFKAPGGVGWVNGMAIDSSDGIMCTTSADMSVAFTDVMTRKGFAVQIPVIHFNGGWLTNGAAVAADPIHHLFVIAQLNSTFSPNGGSTVIVYNEHGHIVEAINGFSFLNRFSPVVVHIAVNPSKRLGYVAGAAGNQLQGFTY